MTTNDLIAFKAQVKQACADVLLQRIANAEQAMQQAQDSANNQEKSSAGDKYETARAMGQADRDMNARQLQEANKDLQFLNNLSISLHSSVTMGSVVKLGEQLFFIAIGLGAISVSSSTVMVISHRSPLFEQLKNKKTGDAVLFQNRSQLLENVF